MPKGFHLEQIFKTINFSSVKSHYDNEIIRRNPNRYLPIEVMELSVEKNKKIKYKEFSFFDYLDRTFKSLGVNNINIRELKNSSKLVLPDLFNYYHWTIEEQQNFFDDRYILRHRILEFYFHDLIMALFKSINESIKLNRDTYKKFEIDLYRFSTKGNHVKNNHDLIDDYYYFKQENFPILKITDLLQYVDNRSPERMNCLDHLNSYVINVKNFETKKEYFFRNEYFHMQNTNNKELQNIPDNTIKNIIDSCKQNKIIKNMDLELEYYCPNLKELKFFRAYSFKKGKSSFVFNSKDKNYLRFQFS